MRKAAIGARFGAAVWVLVAFLSCAQILGITEPTSRTGGKGDAGSVDAATAEAAMAADAFAPTDASTADAADGGQAGPPFYTVSTPTPPPAFLDACALTGSVTVLQAHDNDVTMVAALPFASAFSFYGAPVTKYWVNTNGVLGVDPSLPTINPFVLCPLPMIGVPHPAIYAFADDLETRDSGICIATTGAEPNRQFVVTWKDAMLKGKTSSHLTFSVVLTETTNTVDLAYETLTGGTGGAAEGSGATIGLEDSTGMRTAQFSCRMPMLATTPIDVRFAPIP